jgi:hypothetical protein
MSFEHVAEVFIFILDIKFYNLFFHWSWQVRNVFYYITLFIINHRIRHMTFNNTNNNLRRSSVGDKKEITNFQAGM